MKDIFKNKEFRSKLEKKNRKISSYIEHNNLLIENIMKDFSNYIYTIVRKSYYTISLSDEDIEEIVVDVLFTIWKNQEKLDINQKMSSYIAGITRNLIKKKYRYVKINDNIDDYEGQLIDFDSIELQYTKKETMLKYVEYLKDEDKKIFIDYYYNEKSIKDISKEINMTESKIKSKLFRIRKKLKKILKESGYNLND